MTEDIIDSILWPLDFIGFFGKFFVTFIANLKFILDCKYLHVFLFIFGILINSLIDIWLKSFFKDPRPDHPVLMHIPTWNWLWTGNMTTDKDLYKGSIQYGFPSGHAQGVFYGTSFLFYSGSVGKGMERFFSLWFLLCLFICCITVIQRFKYRRHTIEQLITGAFFGWVIGYFFATFDFIRLFRNIVYN